ncbi:hypothetical protein Lepto7375DRAFT_0120, partial [Leptolyngbya sp. PCC 7375]
QAELLTWSIESTLCQETERKVHMNHFLVFICLLVSYFF